jgi:hypothetical protein
MELLGAEINKPIYADWLFVLGTVVAATRSTAFVCATCGDAGKVVFKEDTNSPFAKTAAGWRRTKARPVCEADPNHKVSEETLGAFVENVALIKKGDVVHTISKELVSRIDYIKNQVRIAPPPDYEGLDAMGLAPDWSTNMMGAVSQ